MAAIKDLPPGAISIEDYIQRNPSSIVYDFSNFYSRPNEEKLNLEELEAKRKAEKNLQLAHSLEIILSHSIPKLPQNVLYQNKELSGKIKIGDIEFSLDSNVFDVVIGDGKIFSIREKTIPELLRISYLEMKKIRSDYIQSNGFSFKKFLKRDYIQNGYLQVYIPGSIRMIRIEHIFLDKFAAYRNKDEKNFVTIMFLHHQKSYSQLQCLAKDECNDADKVIKANIFYHDDSKLKQINIFETKI